MNVCPITFKSQSISSQRFDNLKPDNFFKKDDSKKDNNALYLSLVGLAATAAIGYGIYRYAKSGKAPNIKNKQDVKPEIKPDVKPKVEPSSTTSEASSVVADVKKEVPVKKKLDMSPDEVKAFEFSKIVDIAISQKKEFTEMYGKFKEENDIIKEMLEETKTFQNKRLYDNFADLKIMYNKALQLLSNLSKEMDKMKMLSISSKPREERILELIEIQQKAKGEILEIANLKKQISELYQKLKPVMDALTET